MPIYSWTCKGIAPLTAVRSGTAAYAARCTANHTPSAGPAQRCEVQLAYAIGVADPVSVLVDAFGTGEWSGKIDHFLGIRFKIGDADHFAWARLDVSVESRGVLKDWAYESSPQTALLTGSSNSIPTVPATWGQMKAMYGSAP